MEKIADGNYEDKSYSVKYEEVVDAFLAMLTSDFNDKDIQTVKDGFYLLLTADMVDAAFKEAKRSLKDEVSDSRRIKDSAVDIEDAVYEKFINASAETRDELVELIDKNYDMEEFESTDDLANSLYNYLDFLLPQLSDDAVIDLQDSGYL